MYVYSISSWTTSTLHSELPQHLHGSSWPPRNVYIQMRAKEILWVQRVNWHANPALHQSCEGGKKWNSMKFETSEPFGASEVDHLDEENTLRVSLKDQISPQLGSLLSAMPRIDGWKTQMDGPFSIAKRVLIRPIHLILGKGVVFQFSMNLCRFATTAQTRA